MSCISAIVFGSIPSVEEQPMGLRNVVDSQFISFLLLLFFFGTDIFFWF